MVSKLEQKEPCVYCSVETEAAWNRIPVIQKEDHPDAEYYEDIQLIPVKEEEDDPSPPNCALVEESVDNLTKRKHQNPDEIIKGRSKWTEMKFVRKRRLYGEDVEHEDCFDFDRLNPQARPRGEDAQGVRGVGEVQAGEQAHLPAGQAQEAQVGQTCQKLQNHQDSHEEPQEKSQSLHHSSL